jgi:hypothetical protein
MAIAFLVSFEMALGVFAQQNPSFQASFVPNGAMYPPEQRIDGMTLSIWGENPQSAFALGFVNGSTGESEGLSLGLVNYAESYSGVQWSFINYAEKDFTGWQGGPLLGLVVSGVNYTGGYMRGVQLGVINLAGKLSGFQVGLINYAQYVDPGIQIGLVNVIAQNSGWFTNWPDEVAPGMVLVNWRF